MTKVTKFENIKFGPRPGYPDKDSVSSNLVENFVLNLESEGINRVISLLDNQSAEKYYDSNLHVIYQQLVEKGRLKIMRFPIERFGYPKADNLPDYEGFSSFIEQIYDLGWVDEQVYMHCSGGKGRCGIVIAGLLIKLGEDLEYSITEAKRIAHLRDDGAEQFVREWSCSNYKKL